jgi:hypothetical protein
MDEFTIKQNKWKKGKKNINLGAISAEGPESLYFI